jgi:hypothetical protein
MRKRRVVNPHAQAQRNLRRKHEEAGVVQVNVLVPKTEAKSIKKLAGLLRKGEERANAIKATYPKSLKRLLQDATQRASSSKPK